MNKDTEYTNYIEEHINNVKLMFDKYNKFLINLLPNIDMIRLRDNVMAHDKSKYSKEEFFAYRNRFFPKEGEVFDEESFDIAWSHHIMNNKHHWNHWVVVSDVENDQIKITCLDMDDTSIAEMLLDWFAMSKKFNSKTIDWYRSQCEDKKILLSENTKIKVERVLNELSC